jgi:hypothetical protein
MKAEIEKWMENGRYDSLAQIKGNMRHKSIANPAPYERSNYMKALNEYK